MAQAVISEHVKTRCLRFDAQGISAESNDLQGGYPCHCPPPLPWAEMVAVFSAVAVAYVIFGIAGFGTALIASPILANFLPVSQIVPLLALLDIFAALSHIARDGRQADAAELEQL